MEIDRNDLERLQHGDVRALEACYRAFGSRVHRLALGLFGNRADAEDAVQEIFLKLFERARQFQGGARFSTWVWRLAVNHCLHRLERERVRAAEALPDEGERALADGARSPPELAEASETRESVAALLQLLAPHSRAILVMREIEELSYREIAAALEVPVGTVMSRLARARAKLAEVARVRAATCTRGEA